MLISCQTHFNSRQALCEYVAKLSAQANTTPSHFVGGYQAAQQKLADISPKDYAASRNHLSGKVTQLSPYLRHGIVSDEAVLAQLASLSTIAEQEKLLQQLMWRGFFHHIHLAQPDRVWQDHEDYKTGFASQSYAQQLPDDIQQGKTGIRIIDQMIRTLLTTGYLHNHGRLYLASYIVHWRRIAWQAGARWFLQHLLDGDIACNNYSWQWVASTFSAKPYVFNLDNVRLFAQGVLDTEDVSNQIFDQSYDEIKQQLFPNLAETF